MHSKFPENRTLTQTSYPAVSSQPSKKKSHNKYAPRGRLVRYVTVDGVTGKPPSLGTIFS